MPDHLIEVEHLAKAYRLGGRDFWALKDINFTVERGEVVGVVGRNGAGKTTLLRILSRITEPTKGRAVIRGRVGTLLETGTGFHEDLSGRENIFLNGAILGMRPAEIRRKLDEIVEFSGVGKFIDAAVKSYSSGMRSRLAFSVAAHLETEIMLIDEVLAVGDLAFQEKCLRKMGQLTKQDERTILFVSHSMGAIQSLCNRAVLIENGVVQESGNTNVVIAAYHRLMLGEMGAMDVANAVGRPGTGIVRIVAMRIEDMDGKPLTSVPAGNPARLVLDYKSTLDRRPGEVTVTIVFIGSKGLRLFGTPSDVVRADLTDIAREGSFICTFPTLPLLPGLYDVVVSVIVDRQLTDKLVNVCRLSVEESNYFGTGRLQQVNFGDVLVNFSWSTRRKRVNFGA
jgi:lipopolysaccharide transport system ATP-binding protein